MPLGSFRLNSLAKYQVPVGRTTKTISRFGNAQVSTAQSKFGGASLLLDGVDDWIEAIDASNEWKFSTTSDLTIEGWFRSNNNVGVMLSGYDGTTFRFSFYYDTGEVRFFSPGSGGQRTFDYPSANTWVHWAITRASGTTKFWYNGVETLSFGNSWNVDVTKFILGGENPSGSTIANDYTGYIDEFRVSRIARYTSNFSVATSQFTNDSDTLLLVHMNGTNGSTTFTDDNS